MFNFNVTLRAAKEGFLDRPALQSLVTDAAGQALRKVGAVMMRQARKSIKDANKTRKVSTPGSPPLAQTHYLGKPKPPKPGKPPRKPKRRSQFRDSFLFWFDQSRGSVVIGPTFFPGSRTTPTVPEVLEKGGAGLVIDGHTGRPKLGQYKPRPTMALAYNATQPKVAELLQGSLTKRG
jgi:hypothetical protein